MAFPQGLAVVADNIKARFEEPYVSAAINRMGSALPRGVYRGFTVSEMDTPGAGVKIAPLVNRDSMVLHEDLANGYKTAVRFDEEFDFEFTFDASAADLDLYLWVDVTYQVSSTVTGFIRVGESGDLTANSVPFAKLEIPLGATTILTAYVKQLDSLDNTLEPIPNDVKGNPYAFINQDAWDRFPTQDEKDAMDNAASPSGGNPFATITDTQNKVFAKNVTTIQSVVPPVSSFQLLGTWYVGKGGTGTANKWFELFETDLAGTVKPDGLKDYYTWQAITITEVRESTNFTELDPLNDADADGFYTNPFIHVDTFEVWTEIGVVAGEKTTYGSLSPQEYIQDVLGVQRGINGLVMETIREHAPSTMVVNELSGRRTDFSGSSSLRTALNWMYSNSIHGTVYVRGPKNFVTTGQLFSGTASIGGKIRIVFEPNVYVRRLSATGFPYFQLTSSSARLEIEGMRVSNRVGDVAIDSKTNGGHVRLRNCQIPEECQFGDGLVDVQSCQLGSEDSPVEFYKSYGRVQNSSFLDQLICNQVGNAMGSGVHEERNLVFDGCDAIPEDVSSLTVKYAVVIRGDAGEANYVVFRDCQMDPAAELGNNGGGLIIHDSTNGGKLTMDNCRLASKGDYACFLGDSDGGYPDITLNDVELTTRAIYRAFKLSLRDTDSCKIVIRNMTITVAAAVNSSLDWPLFGLADTGPGTVIEVHGLTINMNGAEPNFGAGESDAKQQAAVALEMNDESSLLMEDLKFVDVGHGRSTIYNVMSLVKLSGLGSTGFGGKATFVRPTIASWSSTFGGSTVSGLCAIYIDGIETGGVVEIVNADLWAAAPPAGATTNSYKGVMVEAGFLYGNFTITGGSIRSWMQNDVFCDCLCNVIINGLSHGTTGSGFHRAGYINARIYLKDYFKAVINGCTYIDFMGATGADQRVWLGVTDVDAGTGQVIAVTGNHVQMADANGKAVEIVTFAVTLPDCTIVGNSGHGDIRYPSGGGLNRIIGASGNQATRSTTFNFNAWTLDEF